MVRKDEPGKQFVIAELAGLKYAVAAERVQEVVPLKEVTIVPGAQGAVVGITNIRGQVRAVLDANTLLGHERISGELKGYMLIIELNGTPYGILFDRVAEVVAVKHAKVGRGQIKTDTGTIPTAEFSLEK